MIEGRLAGPVTNAGKLNAVHETDGLHFSENAVRHETVVEKVSGKQTIGEVGAAAIDVASDMEVSFTQNQEPRRGKASTNPSWLHCCNLCESDSALDFLI